MTKNLLAIVFLLVSGSMQPAEYPGGKKSPGYDKADQVAARFYSGLQTHHKGGRKLSLDASLWGEGDASVSGVKNKRAQADNARSKKQQKTALRVNTSDLDEDYNY